ncbi:hypothetical protein SVXNc_0543 [Candidatus Nanohalococcus occultus]|uniref:Uncharacterized protein n=2 Tax=Candidatus Nanohalococcus occultus TaxID=2978047 RepID=A0ABY8CEB4_9ARCH|nr:hypothetical protein SVXNc_0543 [Candidatus Nanohaloarchaeota archaeon SVXNc]
MRFGEQKVSGLKTSKRIFRVMKRTLALLTAISILIGSTAGLVGSGNSGDMSITAASSSSTSVATDGNGTSYRVDITQVNQSATLTNESVSMTNRTENSVSFEGFIQSPTPCHTLTQDVSKNQSLLEIDIDLEDSGEVCTQQVVMKEYEGRAEMDDLSEVVVKHRGETMAVFETEESSTENNEEDETQGSFRKLMSWLSSLF